MAFLLSLSLQNKRIGPKNLHRLFVDIQAKITQSFHFRATCKKAHIVLPMFVQRATSSGKNWIVFGVINEINTTCAAI